MIDAEAAAAVEGIDCSCSLCGIPIRPGDMILDRKIFKRGELSSIELYHASCSKEDE